MEDLSAAAPSVTSDAVASTAEAVAGSEATAAGATNDTSSNAGTSRFKTLLPVSQSCLRLAALRAEESAREDALVHDDLAAKLAGGMRVDHAPFLCRQVTLPAREQNASTNESDTTGAAVSADSTATVLASTAEKVAAFNQARLEAPDTMIRCRYLDDCVTEYATAGLAAQVVLLGAGLDSRAYRLAALAESRVFELDVAGVVEYKARVLANETLLAREITRVPVDFALTGGAVAVSKTSQRPKKRAKFAHNNNEAASSNAADTAAADPTAASSSDANVASSSRPPWASSLLASGFDPSLPTLWVAEGLLMYLGVKQVSNLLGWIAHLAGPGGAKHHLVADIMNENTVRSKLKWYRFFRWGAARVGGQTAIGPFLRANGWQLALDEQGAPHVHPIGRDGLSYGRYLQPPTMDSTSFPNKPPMLLETYIIRAGLLTNDKTEATDTQRMPIDAST